ncbi:alpha/beta fold hydrolase [Streptomyces sp. NBC_00988]|uniref:thioesterase II family protein n=1 Tax=Streptomyces sp. NBC_00988 TaxID=2903704 RepID=UPI003869B8FF|nr:alpha/beta fold hydrolase [Streptomyces sp. NBC_00988]
MHSASPQKAPSWVRPIPGRTTPGGLRLFCFPYAGAGTSVFREWGVGLPEEVEAFAVQLPGRDDRIFDRPIANLDELLDMLVPALLPYLDRPFAFFGHSMGAIVSWELARRLQQEKGLEPVRVVVSGCRALPYHESRTLDELDLSDEELVNELRRLNGTPEELLQNPDFVTFILPTFRADLSLFASYVYRPGELLNCPVSAFGGDADPRVSVEHLKGWVELTTGPAEVEIFPGGHLFLNGERENVLRSVARALRTVGH